MSLQFPILYMNKKYLLWGISIVLLIAIAFLAYSTKPYLKPTAVNEIKNNPNSYKDKKVMVEGYPVLISSFDTREGRVAFYAIKDDTGQIPVEMNTVGWDFKKEKIAIAGNLGEVCVHGKYDKATDSWACDKKENGIIY